VGEYAEDANYYGEGDHSAVTPLLEDFALLSGCQRPFLLFIVVAMVVMMMVCFCHDFIFVLF